MTSQLELDAYLDSLGGRCGNKVYHLPIARHYQSLHITQLEMVNILLALKILGPSWSKQEFSSNVIIWQ